MKVYLILWNILFLITRRSILPVIVSAQDAVIRKDFTGREAFEREHRHYRIVRWGYEQGHFVSKQHYYRYALIAKKYNWSYIKESYDNTP